jgi:DNA invertase Pin-like site-specific DNA recombinase
MPGRPHPAHTIAAIKSLRAKGFSISEICSAVRAGRATVSRHCKGVRLPDGPLKRGPKFRRSAA